MSAIKVEILHPSENKKQMAEIPDNAPSNRIVTALVRKMGLPLAGPSGERINYKLQHKESGRLLDDNETFADANVQAGDSLRILPEMTAGSSNLIMR